jgi:hypothetical protein
MTERNRLQGHTLRQRHRRRPWTLSAAMVLALASCGDAGPIAAPGDLTATVVSPNGTEGAAMIKVIGAGVLDILALDGRVFSERRGDTTNVVVVNPEGGALRFTISVADTTAPPEAVLVEVAGPDDAIRPLAGYSVEMVR